MTTLTPDAAADLFRQPPQRHIDVGAGEVAHRQVGSGPDVLFVHGWPVWGATFRELLPSLVDHVTCHLIDLPGTGQSRFDESTELSIDHHVRSVVRVVDELGLDEVAVVGHDSGGMIARHAMAGDPRLRAMGLINTEIPGGNSWRFTSFISASRLPGFTSGLGWLAGKPALRRAKFVLGDAFADRSRLDGEFAEFFLDPLHRDERLLGAAGRLVRSFDRRLVDDLPDLHARIDVPVVLVWGGRDVFFPVEKARAMAGEFADARFVEIPHAGLFSHEEAAAEVAEALLPTLVPG